jgi:hypothetical protein
LMSCEVLPQRGPCGVPNNSRQFLRISTDAGQFRRAKSVFVPMPDTFDRPF